MATATQNFGTNTALVVTALHSLADDLYWQSAVIDNGTIKGFWMEVFITILTDTSAGDAAGVIELFLAASVDAGTDFAGGATGTEGTYTDTANVDPKQLRRVGSMPCDASEVTARTYKWSTPVHDIGEDFALVIRNRSGQALGATVNLVEYRLHKYDI